MNTIEYCDYLLQFRAKHKLTQRQVAEILGVHVNIVQRHECGKSTPTPRNRLIFEQALEAYEKSLEK